MTALWHWVLLSNCRELRAIRSMLTAHDACCMQEDLVALRTQAQQHPAAQALPGSWLSLNDLVLAVAWLMHCDMKQRPRPGYAPPGEASHAAIAADLVTNDQGGRLMHTLVPEGRIPRLIHCTSSVRSPAEDVEQSVVQPSYPIISSRL